jgi:hypothetical protein
MRVIGALVVGALMYVAVPMLWQRAILAEVNNISANSTNFPTGNAVAVNFTYDTNVINAINPTVTINTEEYEQIGAQAAADDAMRQMQAAQDQAWAASHPNIP